MTRMERLYKRKERERQMKEWKIVRNMIIVAVGIIVLNLNPVYIPMAMLITATVGIIKNIVLSISEK